MFCCPSECYLPLFHKTCNDTDWILHCLTTIPQPWQAQTLLFKFSMIYSANLAFDWTLLMSLFRIYWGNLNSLTGWLASILWKMITDFWLITSNYDKYTNEQQWTVFERTIHFKWYVVWENGWTNEKACALERFEFLESIVKIRSTFIQCLQCHSVVFISTLRSC